MVPFVLKTKLGLNVKRVDLSGKRKHTIPGRPWRASVEEATSEACGD
jgi:hypothetical protein